MPPFVVNGWVYAAARRARACRQRSPHLFSRGIVSGHHDCPGVKEGKDSSMSGHSSSLQWCGEEARVDQVGVSEDLCVVAEPVSIAQIER